MKLANDIAYLLLENDCIIIPDFGGFITNYKPAIIDEIKHKIYPPNKQVVFNKNLTTNDGLLANYVAKALNINYNSALLKIKEEVNLWRIELDNGGQIPIGEVGFLYQTQNTIKFEQNPEHNILLSSYGLTSIPYTKLKKTTHKIEKITKEESKLEPRTAQKVSNKSTTAEQVKKTYQIKDIVKKTEPKNSSETKVTSTKSVKKSKSKIIPILKFTAVAAIIPLLFYLYWIPMNSNVLENGNLMLSDFNPFHDKSKKYYIIRNKKFIIEDFQTPQNIDELTKNIDSSVKVYNFQFDETTFIPVRLNTFSNSNIETSNKVAISINENNSEIKNDIYNKIHLIAGCFSNKHNADVFVDELKSKGYQAHVVDKNKGLYRVAAASFSSKAKAMAFKGKLEKEGYNSWILKK